jgi:hypothetical protein
MEMRGLLEILSSFRFQYSSEDELQRGISKALDMKRVSCLREHRLDAKDRPDFFVDGICLECKIDGSTQSLLRQVQRYALHTEVLGVIVITNRTRHLSVGGNLNGKPVVVYLVTSL